MQSDFEQPEKAVTMKQTKQIFWLQYKKFVSLSVAPVGSNLQVCQVIKRAIKHREMFENDPILAYDHPPLLFFFNFPQCDYVQQLAGSTHTRIGYQTLYFSGYYEISLQQMFGTITWGLVPGLEEERERSSDVLRKNKNTMVAAVVSHKQSQLKGLSEKNCHGNTAHLIWWDTRSVRTYCISWRHEDYIKSENQIH